MRNCPSCNAPLERLGPALTVDVLIEVDNGVVLIERKNPPQGWALPGGFVDYGETVENAAAREAMEETGLSVKNLVLFGVYSNPTRDPRCHSVSVVFSATAIGTIQAGDDAADAAIFTEDTLPEKIAFDHKRILSEYFRWRRSWV